MEETIVQIYQALDRSKFMGENKEFASHDSAFPIGHGQTISQPSLVLKMTLALEPQADSKVLEIGTGSGYQTALLSEISKKVFTVERVEELQIKAKERLRDLDYHNINYKLDDGNLGWVEEGPYDRIMVTAAAYTLPETLINQLASKGKMVIPIKVNGDQDLLLIEKDENGNVKKEIIERVRFVDLVGDY